MSATYCEHANECPQSCSCPTDCYCRGRTCPLLHPALAAGAWTLTEAVELLRDLETRVVPIGWHVGLLGGVLLKGVSEHDLDIVIYLDTTADAVRGHERLREVLREVGWRLRCDRAGVHAIWRKKNTRNDEKHVEVWQTADGRRVDVHIWPHDMWNQLGSKDHLEQLRGRSPKKPDRRQETRRTDDKRRNKLGAAARSRRR